MTFTYGIGIAIMSRDRLSHYAIFAFAFSCLFDDTTASLTPNGIPQNVIKVAGQNARFNCTTDITTEPNPISWTLNSDKVIKSNCSEAIPGIVQPFLSGQSCDIVVPATTQTDAGTYICYDDTVVPTDKPHVALLLVLDSEPTCMLDRLPVQDQELNIVCNIGSVRYDIAPLSWYPTLTYWVTCDGIGASNVTILNTGTVELQDVSFPMTPRDTVIPERRCDIHFEFNDTYPIQPAKIFATNDVNYTVRVPETLVQFCPKNLTATSEPFFAGTVLDCSAVAYYPASYSWTDNLNTANPPAVAQTYTLPAAGGEFNLSCTAYATGNLTGKCNKTTVVKGFAIVCPRDVIYSPHVTVIEVGDSYNCTSTSNPTANYTWYNTSSGVPVPGGQVISLGPFTLTCNATVTMGGTTCTNSTTVSGTAILCPGPMLITPQKTTVRVGDTFNCSTSSDPPANYTWFDSLNAVQYNSQTVTVAKTGNFTFICNASITVGGRTCSNSTSITGLAISCPQNVAISPTNQQPLVGTVYTCSSDIPADYTMSWSDGTSMFSNVGSSFTANTSGTFLLTCNATVSVDGVSCWNASTINITVVDVTTISLWSSSSETATNNNSIGDASSSSQTGGYTAPAGSGADTGKAIAYILPPIFALMALLALILCIPILARIARRRAVAAAAAAAAASKPPVANQIPLQPTNFRRQIPVWSWSENGPTGLYSPGYNATRPDQINGYGRF